MEFNVLHCVVVLLLGRKPYSCHGRTPGTNCINKLQTCLSAVEKVVAFFPNQCTLAPQFLLFARPPPPPIAPHFLRTFPHCPPTSPHFSFCTAPTCVYSRVASAWVFPTMGTEKLETAGLRDGHGVRDTSSAEKCIKGKVEVDRGLVKGKKRERITWKWLDDGERMGLKGLHCTFTVGVQGT